MCLGPSMLPTFNRHGVPLTPRVPPAPLETTTGNVLNVINETPHALPPPVPTTTDAAARSPHTLLDFFFFCIRRAGDVVIMECMSVMTGDIERGDVVIAKSPTNPRQTVCKRVGCFVSTQSFFLLLFLFSLSFSIPSTARTWCAHDAHTNYLFARRIETLWFGAWQRWGRDRSAEGGQLWGRAAGGGAPGTLVVAGGQQGQLDGFARLRSGTLRDPSGQGVRQGLAGQRVWMGKERGLAFGSG